MIPFCCMTNNKITPNIKGCSKTFMSHMLLNVGWLPFRNQDEGAALSGDLLCSWQREMSRTGRSLQKCMAWILNLLQRQCTYQVNLQGAQRPRGWGRVLPPTGMEGHKISSRGADG